MAVAERERLQDAGLWNLSHRIRQDPVGAAEFLLDRKLWSKQKEILESTFENQRTAVRSGNGVGKSFIAGTVAPLFALAYPNSTVLTTAPTGRQVREVVWREIRTAWAHAQANIALVMARLGIAYEPLPDARQVGINLSTDWFMLGQSTDEPEKFAGYHALNLLLIVDEASGVDEKIFQAAAGNLTSEGARLLLIGNPTKTVGQFYRAFTIEAEVWRKIHISVLDSPNFTHEAKDLGVNSLGQPLAGKLTTPKWVEDHRKIWGENHPLFQVRVLGNFPSQADNTMISISDVEAAQRRDAPDDLIDMDPHPVLACDVARFGSDETVIASKQGPLVTLEEIYHGRDTMVTAGKLILHARRLINEGCLSVRIVIDDAGVGGGVTDRVRELADPRMNVVPYNGGAKPIDETHYVNLRTESWHTLSIRMSELALPTDDLLTADLVAPEYKLDSSGRILLEPKEKTKERLGGRSPDRADAVTMLLYPGHVTLEGIELTKRRDSKSQGPVELTAERPEWEERF